MGLNYSRLYPFPITPSFSFLFPFFSSSQSHRSKPPLYPLCSPQSITHHRPRQTASRKHSLFTSLFVSTLVSIVYRYGTLSRYTRSFYLSQSIVFSSLFYPLWCVCVLFVLLLIRHTFP
ncbi:hypothetical protein BKA57DRAFT_167333 [Linnemannia elongata]|nr:hypothetical protein BKA57DRAFT_167333 [Linnemannia elongata]